MLQNLSGCTCKLPASCAAASSTHQITVCCPAWLVRSRRLPHVQAQEYIVRTADQGVVQGALESFGTPNRLLYVPLTMVPNLIISPAVLQPVVLYEGSFAMTQSQTIYLNNTGNATVDYEVQPGPYPCCTQQEMVVMHGERTV